MTAVYNAANEETAEAFLAGRIRFPQSCGPSARFSPPPTSGPRNPLPWKMYSTLSGGRGRVPATP